MNSPLSSEAPVSTVVTEEDPVAFPLRSADVGDMALADTLPVEHREFRRQAKQLRACLIPLGGADDIHCVTDDVGALGMHITVPVGFGLAVGQRYELRLAEPGASVGMGPLLVDSGHYATVVRTQLHMGEEGDHRIGVGLRFDQPLVGQA